MTQRIRPHVDLEAQCACGAVRLAVHGTIHAMFMCSCSDCQKASGSGHSTVAITSPESVTIVGETRAFARPAASGATFTRHFCPVCGTPIFGKSSRAPRAIMLSVGLFGAATGWYQPNQLIFGRSHRDWDEIAADLPQYETYREGIGG